MKRRAFLANFIGLAAVAATLPARAAQHGHGLVHVVYEIDEKSLSRERAVLRNVRNNLNATGPKHMDLEVVIHGGGIHLLERARTDQQLQATIDNLKLDGVRFRVCHNTLVSNKLDYHHDLYDVHAKDIVPSGVAYLVNRQLQGWAYMHP